MFKFEEKQTEDKPKTKHREGDYIDVMSLSHNVNPSDTHVSLVTTPKYGIKLSEGRRGFAPLSMICKQRNWTRYRLKRTITLLKGIGRGFISEIERQKLDRIVRALEDQFSKEEWDKESVKFGLNPVKND